MSKTFEHDGETYTLLDDDDLTFGEARAIERTAGVRFTDVEGRSSMEFIQALVWASMKRKNVTLAFSEVDDVPMSILNSLMDDEPDEETDDESDPPAAEVDDAPVEPTRIAAVP